MNNIKRVPQETLKVGDIMHLWCGNKMIIGFDKYNGTLDFVDRVVVFYDGDKMSLTKGQYYEILEDLK